MGGRVGVDVAEGVTEADKVGESVALGDGVVEGDEVAVGLGVAVPLGAGLFLTHLIPDPSPGAYTCIIASLRMASACGIKFYVSLL